MFGAISYILGSENISCTGVNYFKGQFKMFLIFYPLGQAYFTVSDLHTLSIHH